MYGSDVSQALLKPVSAGPLDEEKKQGGSWNWDCPELVTTVRFFF
jgi:hypothetical protein